MIDSLMVKDRFVVQWLTQKLVTNSIVGNWFDCNVSNLWFMSVLRNPDVALMSDITCV